MESVVYFSRAISTDRRAALDAILASAERNNPPLGLTGLLLYGEGMFMQCLEGPERSVSLMMERIKADPRHRGAVVLSRGPLSARVFPDWAMGARMLDPDLPGHAELIGSSEAALDGKLTEVSGPETMDHLRRFYQSTIREPR
ncbi:MAG: BLUF domain-containing protein [Pseudomonadota bacterium]